MVSSGCSTPYHDQMDMDLDDAPVAGNMENRSPALSRKTVQDFCCPSFLLQEHHLGPYPFGHDMEWINQRTP